MAWQDACSLLVVDKGVRIVPTGHAPFRIPLHKINDKLTFLACRSSDSTEHQECGAQSCPKLSAHPSAGQVPRLR
jgi:hypothetical protein